MPEFSVIVPVYNVETKIRRCIESILAQTYKDFELLLVDDGSLDNSGMICDEYAAIDVRIYAYHKENGGVASAKNFGIDKAKGTYITFVDSDDFIDDEYLQVLIELSDSADLKIAGLRYLNEVSLKPMKELHLKKLFAKRKDYDSCLSELLDERGLNYHVAKLYKKSIIDKYNIRFTDFRISGGDDTIFNFDFLKYSDNLVVSDRNIYNYILYSMSTSHKYTGDKWERSKNLDSYLRQSVEDMHINNCEITYILDKRLVYAALWSAEELCRVNTLSFYEKKRQFSNISKDTRFIEAFKKYSCLKENNKSIYYLSINHWLSFYIVETEFQMRVKSFFNRLIPCPIKLFFLNRKEK